MIKAVFYYIEYIFVLKDDVQSYFVLTLISWLICPCWNTIPIMFILYKHHVTFKT